MSDPIHGASEKQPQLLDQILAIGHAVQQHITQSPKIVYQLIVETACRMTGADCAVIYPYHPSFGEFYDVENIAAYGLRHELQVEKQSDKRRRLKARIHQAGEIIHEDIEQESSHMQISPFVTREGINASMGMSLKFGDDIVGIFYVDYRAPHRFSEEEKRIIRLLGQQAALAVSNSWTFRLADIRAGAIAKLKTVGQILATVSDPTHMLNSVLEGIARNALEVLDADIVDLYQYIQARKEFVLPPILIGDRKHPDLIPSKIYADDAVLKAVDLGTPQYFQEAQDASVLTTEYEVARDDMPHQRFVVREGIASSALIPLITAGETVGVMFVNYRAPQFFGPEQRDVIESFAAQAAIAIHNARLYALEQDRVINLRRQQNSLQAIAEFQREISGILPVQDQLEQIYEKMSGLMDTSNMFIALYDENTDLISFPLVFEKGELIEDVLKVEGRPYTQRRYGTLQGLVEWVINHKEPLLIEDFERWVVGQTEVEGNFYEDVTCCLLAPMLVRDKLVGVIGLQNFDRPTVFNTGDRDLLATIAGQAAIAIENARLYQAERARRQELEAVQKASLSLTASLQLSQVLDSIVRAAFDLVSARDVHIFLYTNNRLIFGAAMGTEGLLATPFAEPRPYGLTYSVARQGETILVSDMRTHPLFADAPSDWEGAIVGLPLKIGQRVVGVMNVSRQKPIDLLEVQLPALRLLADQAAITIENARLYQALERRVKALTTLNEVGQTLTSGIRLEENEILELIYDQACQLTGAQDMYIALYDEATQMIRFKLAMEKSQRVDTGKEKGWAPRKANMEQRGKTEEIVFTRQPLLHRTKQETEEWYQLPGHREFLGRIQPSYLGVPMMIGERVLGMIAVYDWEREYAYDELDLQVLSSMASQAAIALDNANLYTRRVRDLEALNRIGQTLTSGSLLRQESRLDENEILELIYEQAHQLTRTQDMYIALYDEATGMISFGLAMEKSQRVDTGEEVIFTRQPILHRTEEESEGWYQKPEHQEFLGHVAPSWLGVPMVIGEKVLGMIAIYDWEREYVYDKLDQQVLSSMASQAAIALDNANLYRDLTEANRALERRVRALTALNEVGRTLTSGIRLGQDEILVLMYEQARKLTDTQNIYIALYDEVTGILLFGLAMENAQRVTIEPRQADMERRGKTEEVIFTRQPLLHRTVQESRSWYDLPGHQEFRKPAAISWLGVPMVVGERVLGMIAIYDWERENVFDELDLQVLSSMASQAAIALDNANLYRDLAEANRALERRVEALTALNEVGRTLTSGIRLKQGQILGLIYDQVRGLTGTKNIYIALYDNTTRMIKFGLAMERGQRVTIEPRQADMEHRGKTEEVIFTRQPLLHRTAQESREWYDLAEHQKFTGHVQPSYLSVPMIVEAKVLGVIAIYDEEREYVYDEQDAQVLALMASQAAIALDNATLYSQLERRIEQMQTVQQITSAIKVYAELQVLLRSILEVSLPRLKAQAGTIQFLDRTTEELVVQAAVGPIEQMQYERISLDLGITGQAAREERSIYVADASQDKRFLDYLGPMRSELAIPLHAEDEVIGVFNIEDPQPDAFDDETCELAELIADQVAIVIQNARRREELIAARQLATLGTVTAAIQHRINNTLNIIAPNITRLRKRVNLEDETIQEILDLIERNTKSTTEYINRIQEPLKETEIQAIDINACLHEAHTRVQEEYQGKTGFGTVEVAYNLNEALPLIEASSGQITEVFHNLIENGYKAMGADGGTLTIVSRQVDSWLEVEIQDTGPGIPPEIRDWLFVKPVPSRQPGQHGQGSGLGLWLSALLLQKYAGEIKVVTTGPGGTIMLVRLPVSSR
ncbi:MAG: GAF domain-containing protein [Chloroflexi bacterium]|nr:GAF domain-containing protein [Chloroflexota bacterium]